MITENQGGGWHQKILGTWFIDTEKNVLAEKLSSICGYHLLFMGDRKLARIVSQSLISHRVVLSPEKSKDASSMSALQGAMDDIPLLTDSVDAVVLSHVLEHAAMPHDVLREVYRVLIPEGHIIITGFNPWSFWGLWHSWQKLLGNIPKQGKMLGITRIRDWLSLLNFEIVEEKMFYFRPPIENQRLQEKLIFLEKWGKILWPFWGGGYCLIAAKRVIPLTPIRLRWRQKPLWEPAAANSIREAAIPAEQRTCASKSEKEN